ncbi:MAG: hypothetical protein J5379_07530 [Clostridiales bacterium]|nr:hypothetical protein [Clostridiales bacterium]
MLNLIKMNLYRMTHAVSTWVLAIVAVLYGLMQFGIMKIIMDDPFNIMEGMSEAMGLSEATAASVFTSIIRSSDFLIIAAIFIVLFSNAEQKCGFDKNIIGITKNKWKHTLARWISAVIGMTGLVVLAGGVALGASALFLNAFTAGSATMFLKSLGLSYVGLLAFSAVFFFFTTLFRSAAGGIVPSLIISLGILYLIENLMDLLVKKLISNPAVLPTDFFLDSQVMNFDFSSGTKACVILCVLCAGYIVAALGGSMLLQQKRDVK